MFLKSTLITLLTGLLFISGCVTSNTSITVTKENLNGTTVSRVLILALTPIDENKETGEKELAYWLNKEGIKAVASFDQMSVRGRLPVREEVRRVLESDDYDGVLTLKLINVDENSRYVSSAEKSATTTEELYFYNYLNAWNSAYTPGYYSNSKLMVIESNLYSLPKGEIIYSMVSESFLSDSFETFANDLSKALTQSLRKGGNLASDIK